MTRPGGISSVRGVVLHPFVGTDFSDIRSSAEMEGGASVVSSSISESRHEQFPFPSLDLSSCAITYAVGEQG